METCRCRLGSRAAEPPRQYLLAVMGWRRANKLPLSPDKMGVLSVGLN